ncbi:FeoB-associated Cys-rich membrane protein [Enterococcus sp. LJL120]
MATFIIAAGIFGFAGYVVYKKIKAPSDCGDCHCDCTVKPQEEK